MEPSEATGEICLRRRRVTHSGEDPATTTSNNDSLASELENDDADHIDDSVFNDKTILEQSPLLQRRLSTSPGGTGPTEKLKLIIGSDVDAPPISPDDVKNDESLLKPNKLGVLEFVWMELTR